jgi:FMN-dependent NADH-azoreductase
MPNILLITSSPRIDSYSTRVARILADKLKMQSGASVTEKDLTRQPLPHIDDTFAIARNQPPERLTVAQRSALDLSDKLLKELCAADVLVVAAGMINFGIPSSLKAYIDHVLRPGIAFRYTKSGAVGLLTGKKAFLVVARGGYYSEPHMQSLNFQDTYLRAVLGFIGITDIEVIAVEGVAFGPQVAEKGVSAALARVDLLVSHAIASGLSLGPRSKDGQGVAPNG